MEDQRDEIKKQFRDMEIQVGSYVARKSAKKLLWEHEHPILAFLKRCFFIIN